VELEGIEPSTSSMPSKVRIDRQGLRKGLVLEDHTGGYRIEPHRHRLGKRQRFTYESSSPASQ